jgi:hypothetical protein
MDDHPDKTTDQDLPSSVSSQNREQAEPGHGSGQERHQRPDTEPDHAGERGSGGESGEGSQSTGDPRSAG